MADKTNELVIEVAMALVIIIAGWLVIRIMLRVERKALEKSRLDKVMHPFILRATNIALWILLIIAVLPKSAPFVAAIGAGGAAIAFALKDSLGNVAGGILLLVNKPFIQGDTINVNGTEGIVDSIDLMTTQLHTADNKVVIVPNGVLNTSIIINNSKEEMRRVDCSFGISYTSDIQKAKEVLYSTAKQCSEIKGSPEPVIGVSSCGDSAVILDLKVWCDTPDYFNVKYYLEEAVKLAFDKEKIVMPYPQMDIHVTQ